MFYKKICSPTFKKELSEIHKYIVDDLKSQVGWQMVNRYLWCVTSGDNLSPNIQFSKNKNIKRITVENYTVIYEINHSKEEIYFLHLIYRKY